MAAKGDMYGGMGGTMSPSETKYNIGSAFGDKLISQKGKWMWSPALEGVLVQVSPEGRILIHNPATGETTGEEPVVVRSQDIFKIGETEPHNRTERIEKAVENAFAYYKETPDGKEASKIADVIKAQGLRTSSLQVGTYYKPNFSGTYKFTDKGVEYSGGLDKRTGQSVAPAVYPKSQFDAPPPSGEGGWIYEGEEGYDETMAGAVSPTPTTGGGETPSDKRTYFPESTRGPNAPASPETQDMARPASPETQDIDRPAASNPAVSPKSTPLQGSANYYERLLNPNRTMIGSAEEAYAKATASPKEPDQSPAERSYFFGYGGAGAKGPELAQRDQDILGQDSYILGQSSGLTFRGPTEQPAAPFKERSGAARRARIRQGQFSIAEPKREFLRGQARAVRGATEIATQELLKRTGKTADEIRALKDTDPKQFERLRAERDMRMQNLVNPDRPQFKAEDITEVYDNGRATGTFAPDVDSRDQRIFREQRTAPMEVPVGEYEKQVDPNKSFPDKKVGKIMFDKNRNVVGYSGSRDQAREAAKSNPALADFLKAAKPMSREERQQSERADELARTGQIPESANVDKGYFPPQEKPTTTPATNMAEPKKKKARGRFGAGR